MEENSNLKFNSFRLYNNNKKKRELTKKINILKLKIPLFSFQGEYIYILNIYQIKKKEEEEV